MNHNAGGAGREAGGGGGVGQGAVAVSKKEKTMALKWQLTSNDEQEIKTGTDESKPGTKYTITHPKPKFHLHYEKHGTRSPLGSADSWEEAEKFANDHAKGNIL